MGKLYTRYYGPEDESNEAFMVTFQGTSVQAYAYSSDIYPSEDSGTYIKVTDGAGHDVKAVIPGETDTTPRQLIIRLIEGSSGDLCFVEADGAISDTSISVTDVSEEPTPQPVARHRYRYSAPDGGIVIALSSDDPDAVLEGEGTNEVSITAAEGSTIYANVTGEGYEDASFTATMGIFDDSVEINLVPTGSRAAWNGYGHLYFTYNINWGDHTEVQLFDHADELEDLEVSTIHRSCGVPTSLVVEDGNEYYRDPNNDSPPY